MARDAEVTGGVLASPARRALRGAAMAVLVVTALGCAGEPRTRYLGAAGPAARLSDDVVRLNSSAPPLDVRRAVVLTDNDAAFAAKLEAIRGARRSVDLAYFIFADDHTSAVLSRALVDAAQRGVRVRILIDYFRNYRDLDYFAMLEREGAGRLEVRFWNRPPTSVIRDAVYLTLGCGEVAPGGGLAGCAEAKYARIDELFAAEDREERRTAAPSNFNSGGSGLFLSGLYGANFGIMAAAIKDGQRLGAPTAGADAPAAATPRRLTERQVDLAIAGARVVWQARDSNPRALQQLGARLKVELALALYGEKLNGLRDTVTAHAPVGKRAGSRESIRNWDYLTAFVHHKLLLVDEARLQIGGRNLEDPYHVGPTPLVGERYLFFDTDVAVDLASGGEALTRSFEWMWGYAPMIARLDDIRRHAPNDVQVATERADAACREIDRRARRPEHDACRERVLAAQADLETRIRERRDGMLAKSARYAAEYRPAVGTDPPLEVDAGARLHYVENLPFERPRAGSPGERIFGSVNGREGESGKYIHNVWLAGLRNACAEATAERPQRVLMHSAYFILPSNLLRQVGAIVRGDLPCPHVQVTVLTNSPESTDLAIINLAARYSLKALADHALARPDPARGATFRYVEYRKRVTAEEPGGRSLHSKVMLFGPDLFIGSANADVRSYMLDTNNGLLVRGAPRLVAAYTAWVDRILADPALVTDRTRYFVDTSRDAMLAADREAIAVVLRRLAAGAEVDDRVPLDHVALRLTGILTKLYDLSTALLRGDREAERVHDALFKLL